MGESDQQGAIVSREETSDGLLFAILILVAVLLTAACGPGLDGHASGAAPVLRDTGPAADLHELAVLLSTDRAIYEQAAPVFVTFTLANHSGEDHYLPRLTTAGPGAWHIEVRDAGGQAIVPPGERSAAPAAREMERLDAGRFVRVTCPLEACPVLGPVDPDLPPGTYSLVGVYESAGGGAGEGPVWSGRLESEPVRIEITGGSVLARN